MKVILPAVLSLLISSGGAWSQAPEPAAQGPVTPADLATRAVTAAFARKPLDPVSTLYLTLGFYVDFPDDQRSISLLRNILWLEDTPGWANKQDDLPETDKAAYRQLLKQKLALTLARTDLPEAVRNMLMRLNMEREVRVQRVADKPDTVLVRSMLDEMRSRYPKLYEAAQELDYVGMLEKTDPAAAMAHLQKLTTDPNPRLAVMARGSLAVREAYRTPMQIKFTALDGRKVDLKKMRGKVVLVEFWATWCTPCIQEFPNIQNVYRDYHDRGFEVIGVAIDGAAEEQKLRKMVAEMKLPWPQHYDGKSWNNEIAARFGINAIPAMFLLDRKGLLVSTNARGERLATEVKRLLGI